MLGSFEDGASGDVSEGAGSATSETAGTPLVASVRQPVADSNPTATESFTAFIA